MEPIPNDPLTKEEQEIHKNDLLLEAHRAQVEKTKQKKVEPPKDLLDPGARLNEFNWPKAWDRHTKKMYKKVCKRCRKKGFAPSSPEWDHEMQRAGFKKTEKKND